MATTWIKPIHKAKGRSVAATLADSIGYADNPDKTNSYEYVKSYGCDYYTAANEFALSKELYEQQTGRGGRNGDILAYHVRYPYKNKIRTFLADCSKILTYRRKSAYYINKSYWVHIYSVEYVTEVKNHESRKSRKSRKSVSRTHREHGRTRLQ